MLALTENAADAIRQLTATPIADGIRISVGAASTDGGGPGLQIQPVTGPVAEDAVVEAGGARLFVEPTAMAMLDDKVLDAEIEGEQVNFAIFEQPDEDSPA